MAACAVLAACGAAPNPIVVTDTVPQSLILEPSRPLPVLGRIDATYDGQPVIWQTLDFSVGAIDPSVIVDRYEGVIMVMIEGYLPGQENREAFGRLRIEGTLPIGPVPGAATDVIITVLDVPGFETPRYASGPVATLQITQIALPASEGEVFGTIAGNFAASLCRSVSPDTPRDLLDCKPITGVFETSGSFENLR